MSTVVTQKRVKIQSFLISSAKEGTFASVTYDKTTDLPVLGAVVAPKSVRCNEVSSEFAVDNKQMRKLAGYRTGWRFQLLVEFDGEVDLSDFEESFLANLLRPPEFPVSILVPVSVIVTHPPQEQPSGGTKADYTFDIVPLRA